MCNRRNVVITGFMGTGKTTVGRLVAARLGCPFVDMDERIESRTGRTVRQIFDEQGEAKFRKLESELCGTLAATRGHVIATGGGTLLCAENRKRLLDSAIGICLRADHKEILRRLRRAADRPLLEPSNREHQMNRLLAEREQAYGKVPWHIDTTGRSPEEIAEEIIHLIRTRTRRVGSGTTSYTVFNGIGLRHRIGDLLRSATGASSVPVGVVTNPTVGDLYADDVLGSLSDAGFRPHACMIPDGEPAKTLATVRDLYMQFVSAGLDRSSAVIALGGGVTGDLVGFAAATFSRGVRWLVHMPTTLIAMIDASLGGKTGVDLPQGKNLVGAFFDPSMVIADVETLGTLAEAELRSGIAEALKHGIVSAPDLFDTLASETLTRADWTGDAGVEMIAQAQSVKIQLIEEDPRERGRRIFLNLGHTVGHAIEAVSAYRIRHGEAVAIGLVAATHIAVSQGMASESVVESVTAALDQLQLPVRCPSYSVDALLEAMNTDKKREHGRLQWVLPRSIGTVDTAEVPLCTVREALLTLGAKED